MDLAVGNNSEEEEIGDRNEIKVKDKNSKCNLTPFHFAAAYGHLDLCKYVSKDLEDMSPKCNLGQTPLHLAASNGHLDVCKHIMEKTTNKSQKNNDGETPLHLAAYQVV